MRSGWVVDFDVRTGCRSPSQRGMRYRMKQCLRCAHERVERGPHVAEDWLSLRRNHVSEETDKHVQLLLLRLKLRLNAEHAVVQLQEVFPETNENLIIDQLNRLG